MCSSNLANFIASHITEYNSNDLNELCEVLKIIIDLYFNFILYCPNTFDLQEFCKKILAFEVCEKLVDHVLESLFSQINKISDSLKYIENIIEIIILPELKENVYQVYYDKLLNTEYDIYFSKSSTSNLALKVLNSENLKNRFTILDTLIPIFTQNLRVPELKRMLIIINSFPDSELVSKIFSILLLACQKSQEPSKFFKIEKNEPLSFVNDSNKVEVKGFIFFVRFRFENTQDEQIFVFENKINKVNISLSIKNNRIELVFKKNQKSYPVDKHNDIILHDQWNLLLFSYNLNQKQPNIRIFLNSKVYASSDCESLELMDRISNFYITINGCIEYCYLFSSPLNCEKLSQGPEELKGINKIIDEDPEMRESIIFKWTGQNYYPESKFFNIKPDYKYIHVSNTTFLEALEATEPHYLLLLLEKSSNPIDFLSFLQILQNLADYCSESIFDNTFFILLKSILEEKNLKVTDEIIFNFELFLIKIKN